MASKNSENDNKGSMLFKSLRSALAACAVSVALVALYALVLQQQWLDAGTVGTANTVIKLLSSAFAALLASRGAGRAWLWGAASAGMYMLLTFMVFSMLSGDFSLGLNVLSDLGMCMLCGAVTGMLKNLIKR